MPSFRYSAVNCSYFCPKKYELEYVLGVRSPTNSLDLAFGTAVHAGINSHFEGGDAVETFQMAWNSTDKTWEKSRFDHTQLQGIGERMLTKWVRMHSAKYKPMYVEQSLSFKIGDYAFTGTPDFIGTIDGKISVVDWKTSAYRFDKRSPIVLEQLWIYAEACKQNYGFYPEQVVYAVFVKGGASVQNPVCYEFTEGKLKKVLDNVAAVAHTLATAKVFTKNTTNCLKCAHITTCYPGEIVNE